MPTSDDDIFSITSEPTHGRGYIYCLQYHLVWCTKYRKPVLVDGVRADLLALLDKYAKELDMEILACEIMPDHVHLLVSAKPQLRLSDAVKVLKGSSARRLLLDHPEIKSELWGGHLWNPTYFAATVSDRTREQVRRYIETQGERP